MSAMIRGAKGGDSQPHAATEAPDSLHSIAYARILDLVSEGEIEGFAHPANPLQDIYLDSTPLANADGSLNFKNVQVDSRSGTQTQTVLTGFPDVENETAINVELKSTADWTQAIADLSLNAVRVMLSVPALSKSDTNTGDITGYSVQYEIDLQTDGGSWQTMLTSAFTGKTTSKYERSHRIDLPAATMGWTLRVHRITANQNLATIADTVMIESYTEIVDAKFSYPNSALVGLIIDASQFSSIPQRAYNLLGRIVSVPSNYDPNARTYTGAWDGTFKPAWTNNPAWIFYDLALSLRYGLGRYITAAQLNKWNLYNIAQYCDGMVSDGMGGQEPRFTCSLFLQKQADAYKVLQDLAAVFRGISFWGAGAINAVADMPGDPVYTYTAANVLNGKFTYQGSSKTTRYTVALVSWNDPADMGRAKVDFVPDRDGIARYGVNITQVTATGATSRGQAQRVGLWTLLTSRIETESVIFGVGLDGTIAAPGQIIRIADPARAGKRQAGRISAATATDITVDAAPTVAVGDNFTCTLSSGVTETHAVTAVAGNVISVAAPGFSIMPLPEAIWVTESATLAAQTFRVVSVAEDQSGQNLGFTITALAHNASKFDAIDAGAPIVVPPITAIPPSVQPAPATVTLESFPTFGQVLTQTTLAIQWEAAPDAVFYRVEWRKDNGDWQQMPIQHGLSVDVHVWPGSYIARVAAVNASGIGSVTTVSDAYVVVDQTQQSQIVAALGTEVATAQSDADAANAALANIASDNLLSAGEKPPVIRDYSVILTDHAGIDAQADAYNITTEKTAYDDAISALTAYLAGLTTPTAWNNLAGDTDIDGTTFRGKFADVYTARQTLLNAIYAAAKGLADTAQASATVINPNFTTQDSTGWTPDAAGWTFNQSGGSPNAAIPTYAQFFNGPAATACRNKACVPCQAGDVFAASCQILGDSGTGYALTKIYWYNASSAEISEMDGNHITLNGNGTSRAVGIAPADAVFCVAAIAVNGYTTGGGGGAYHFTGVTLTKQPSTVDETPDGVTYAKVAGSNLTGGNVDLAKGVAGKNLGNIADGGGRYGVHAVDSNGLALVDFSQAGHVNKNLGNVPDGDTRFAAAEAGADKTAGKSLTVLTDRNLDNISDTPNFARIAAMAGTPGAVQIDNANFQLAWNIGWAANGAIAFTQSASPAPAFGAQYVVVDTTGGANTSIQTTRKYNCNPGDKISVGALLYAASGTAAVGVSFFQGNGTFISTLFTTSAVAAWTAVTKNGVVPANAAYFLLTIFNTAASSFTGCNYIWCSINDVRVAGSGQTIGDQRNLVSSITRNAGLVRSATALTATSAGAVNVNAHTITLGAAAIGYNAVTNAVTGLSIGSGYYIYTRDNYAGGTQTWAANGNANIVNGYDDAYNAGYVTIPSSGTSGGGGAGGGGGGSCVCADMYLRPGLAARDLAKRWRWWKPWFWFLRGREGWHLIRRRPRVVQEICMRITVADGSTIDCSVSTPITTHSGESVQAPMAYGSLIWTDSGWQRVIECESLHGERDVVRICVGGHSFLAGTNPYHRIDTHNVWKP